MVGFMMFMADLGRKILGIMFGFMILMGILKNGPETLKAILRTMTIGIQALCVAIRKKLLNYLRKEAGVETDDPEAKEESAEGTA